MVLSAYAIGSVPFAWLLARRWGAHDLRHVGSGNLGAANVLRASGVTAGLLVALLDITKGALSVMIARYVSDQPAAPAAAGLAAIVGHIYPVWLRFRGGKGVATAIGGFVVLCPGAILLALAAFALVVAATRFVSLGSLTAACLLPVSMGLAFHAPEAEIIAAAVVTVLLVFSHRANIRRLLDGTERRLGRKKA